jgi:hypothetical protein
MMMMLATPVAKNDPKIPNKDSKLPKERNSKLDTELQFKMFGQQRQLNPD